MYKERQINNDVRCARIDRQANMFECQFDALLVNPQFAICRALQQTFIFHNNLQVLIRCWQKLLSYYYKLPCTIKRTVSLGILRQKTGILYLFQHIVEICTIKERTFANISITYGSIFLCIRSDESDPEEHDTVERDAMLLAQTFANQDKVIK